MEITLNRNSLKKAFSALIVVVLFFGMCSPAVPYLPEISFEAKAIAEVVTSGNCGSDAIYELYDDGALVISGSGTIGYYDFDIIQNYSFNNFVRENSKNVYIENGITKIHANAFRGFKNIKKVEMADSVVELSKDYDSNTDHFAYCEKLESIKLSKNLTGLPNYCFEGCTSLKLIEIPNSVTEIGGLTFKDCTSLESVKLSENLKVLGVKCFEGCISLKSIVIPNGVRRINSYAFGGCTSLESVKLSESLTELDDSCFRDCRSLKSIVIPDGVTAIGSFAFYGCTSLESVVFNEGLKDIGVNAFSSCLFLEKINLPSTVKTIESNAFNGCIYLEEVTIPESVTSISSGLFTNCIRLSKVTIMNPDCKIAYNRGTIPETAVIYGYSDSTAEKYATDWLRKFVPLDREHDHEFESNVILKATCTTTGIEEYTCYCGESRTETIPTNYHFDVDEDDNCDMCGIKLNSYGDSVMPDDGEQQKNEDEKNVFEKFFDALINFFKKFSNLFDVFKNLG